jgi:hypothetical protein
LGDDCHQGILVILCDVTLILATEIMVVIGSRSQNYFNNKTLVLNLDQRCRVSAICSLRVGAQRGVVHPLSVKF